MKSMKKLKRITSFMAVITLLSIITPVCIYSQIPRERAVPDRPVTMIFRASQNIGITTVETPETKNLNTSVLHTFGLVEGGVERFFGLDDGANTRIGLEYGITDRFSIGAGRMTLRKVIDVNTTLKILQQTESGSVPIDVAFYFLTGISTVPGQGLEFSERLSYLVSLLAARKLNRFSFQLSPMFSHFNTVPGDNPKNIFGVGLAAQFEISDRYAISAEYIPVIGDRFTGTVNSVGIALNIDTGGHIFQLFFTSNRFHNEQFIMANNRDKVWDGEFRFGFNIHRMFGLGN
jgi:hypothetical protein